MTNNSEGNIMKLTPEQEEQQHIEGILHYMDEYPCSGQNREGAVIIRKLLAAAPLVAVIDDNGDTIVSHDEAKQFAYLNRKRSNISRCYLALVGQVAPSETERDKKIRAVETPTDYPIEGVFGQVAPQATSEHMENIHELAKRLQNRAYIHGNTDSASHHSDSYYRHAKAESDDALGALVNACKVIATPPTSKADTSEAIRNAALEEAAKWFEDHVTILPDSEECARVVRTLKSVTPSTNDDAKLNKFATDLANNQQPLGEPATKVLSDNAWSLYARSGSPSTIKVEQATDKHPSALSIAGIARKHFGSPIPPAAYAFASELIAATLATVKAEPKIYSTDTVVHSVGDTESVSLRSAEVLIKSGLKSVRNGFKAEPTGEQL